MTATAVNPRTKAAVTSTKAASSSTKAPSPPSKRPPSSSTAPAAAPVVNSRRRGYTPLTPMRAHAAQSMSRLADKMTDDHASPARQHLRDAARVLRAGNEDGAQRHLRAAMFALTPQSLMRNGHHTDDAHNSAREAMHGIHRHLLLVKDIADAAAGNQAAAAPRPPGDQVPRQLNSGRQLAYGRDDLARVIDLVGPHGYIHGWIFVGIPGAGQKVTFAAGKHATGTVEGADATHVHVRMADGSVARVPHNGGTGSGKLAKIPTAVPQYTSTRASRDQVSKALTAALGAHSDKAMSPEGKRTQADLLARAVGSDSRLSGDEVLNEHVSGMRASLGAGDAASFDAHRDAAEARIRQHGMMPAGDLEDNGRGGTGTIPGVKGKAGTGKGKRLSLLSERLSGGDRVSGLMKAGDTQDGYQAIGQAPAGIIAGAGISDPWWMAGPGGTFALSVRDKRTGTDKRVLVPWSGEKQQQAEADAVKATRRSGVDYFSGGSDAQQALARTAARRAGIPADKMTIASDKRAAARSMSDADLSQADAEFSRRATLLGKPGQVSKSHKAVADEMRRRAIPAADPRAEAVKRHASWMRIGNFQDSTDHRTGYKSSSLGRTADFGASVHQLSPGNFHWSVTRQRTEREGPDASGYHSQRFGLPRGTAPTRAGAKSAALKAMKQSRAAHIAAGGDVGYGDAPTGDEIRSISMSVTWHDVEAVIELSAQTPALASVHHPFGKPGGPGLWHQKNMELPAYVQNIAHALLRAGRAKTESEAIAMARAATRRWLHGKHTKPEVRAAAAGSDAEWQADQARAHAHAVTWDEVARVIELGGQQQPPPYNPAQARVPKGQLGGGQFAKGSGSSAAAAKPDAHQLHVLHEEHLQNQSAQQRGKSAASATASKTASGTAKATTAKDQQQKTALLQQAAGYRAKADALIKQRDALRAELASAAGQTSTGQSGSTTTSQSGSTTSSGASTTASTSTTSAAGSTTSSTAGTTAGGTTPNPATSTASIAQVTAQIKALNAQIVQQQTLYAQAMAQAAKL